MKKVVGLFLLFISFSLIFFIIYGQNSSESIQEEMKKSIRTKYLEQNEENELISDEEIISIDEVDKMIELFEEKEQSTQVVEITDNKKVQENERKKVVENALAILTIPSIKLEVAVSEGISEVNLKYSVAHYTNSATFGEVGNACVVGHRTHTYNHFFYKLDKVKKGDTIYIDTGDNKMSYKVYDIFIVEPKDVWVYDSSDSRELTLITCTPIRVSTHRLIIKAQLIEK